MSPVAMDRSRSDLSSFQESSTADESSSSAGKARSSRRKGRRECYTRFSAEEQAMLLDGVEKYGAGNWKKILASYDFHQKRTAVDLKDKYRNILRAQERARQQSQASSAHSGSSGHSGGSRVHHAEAQYGRMGNHYASPPPQFPPLSDVPAPAEPPVSMVPSIPGASSGSLSRAPMNLTPLRRPSRSSSSKEKKEGNGSSSVEPGSRSDSRSSMPVESLLTAPDVHY